jgi:hypothetical protein
MGRKPIFAQAMTGYERLKRHRKKTRIERLRRELKAYRDPAAKRPTPKRAGLDFWPTPPDVAAVLVQRVLPVFGSGVRIWECAAGDGRLGDAMTAAGYDVVMTDANPQRPDIKQLDFLKDPPPNSAVGSVAITNPPFAGSGLGDAFIARALELIDSGFLRGWSCCRGAERIRRPAAPIFLTGRLPSTDAIGARAGSPAPRRDRDGGLAGSYGAPAKRGLPSPSASRAKAWEIPNDETETSYYP